MARSFREIENPERRIEKEGDFSQTTQFTPNNSRQADIPAKENSTYRYSQLNMKIVGIKIDHGDQMKKNKNK